MSAALIFAAELPKLAARVTDLTGTLHAQQVATLEAKLAAIEQRKGSQVVVAVVPTTQPDTIEQYAVALFEHNEIGRKGVDDGVLLLVAKDDRKVRIEVGYGLEGAIPDLYAHRIISEYVEPKFRNGDFYGGIDEATTALGKLVEGEALPEPLHEAPRPGGDAGGAVMFAVFIGFFAAQLVAAFVRRRKGARVLAGGTLAAIASTMMLGALFPVAIATIVAMFMGVVTMAPSGVIGRGGGIGGGGSWGGGGSGGGGGGGWSGGGGRSGGGGASGSW